MQHTNCPQKSEQQLAVANGAFEDGVTRHVPIVFLAGPIKHWWSCWGSPEHTAYVKHRDLLRQTLIDAGYLTYASWDAFKGSWDNRAQAINDAAIAVADVMLVMTPPGIPANGTTEEVALAKKLGVRVTHAIPGLLPEDLIAFLAEAVGKGVPYT